ASVVMIENFVRRLRDPARHSDPREEIRLAASEVARPVVFGVAIIVAGYIPIFTLEGIEGRMFRPMAFTGCAAGLGSLVLALTYIPATSSFILHRATNARADAHDGAWFVRLRAAYARWLDRTLAAPRRTMTVAVALLALSLAAVPLLGTEF